MIRSGLLPPIVLALACETATTPLTPKPGTSASRGTAPSARGPSSDAKLFGAPLSAAPRERLEAVLGEPSAHAGKTMVVEGHVRRACSKKGCWMELATSADPASPSCRVTFEDYGFFVPTDSAGSRARLEGVMNVRRLEPGLVSHLEAEGASFPKKDPDGSAEEARFVATGVELSRS
jgi:hypothetical protein